jgi:hypothetical protein
LTLGQAQNLEYLLILHVKGELLDSLIITFLCLEQEKNLAPEQRSMTNDRNGTSSTELGRLTSDERLKLAE